MRGLAILEDGSTHGISLLDLSYDGCGIVTPVALEPGDTDVLGWHNATAAWNVIQESRVRFAATQALSLFFDDEQEEALQCRA